MSPIQRPHYPPVIEVNVPREIIAASVHVRLDRAAGSGTVVYVDAARGSGIVLTNRHVVSGSGPKARVKFPDGREVYGDVLGIDKAGGDLGAIAIPADESTPYIPLADQSPPIGSLICQVGYGGGTMRQRSGTLARYREGPPWQMALPFQVIPGDSGSGVFLVKEKRLVGVVWGYVGYDGANESQAVTLANANRFCLACRPLLPWRRGIERQIGNRPSVPPSVPPVGIPPSIPPDYGLDGIKKEIQDLRDAVSKIPSGPAGKDGADGRAGVVGPPGPDGLRGPAGKDGMAGLQGAPGLPGKDGKNGVDGSPGLDGKDGKDGLQGPSGKDGAAGKDADSGLQAQIDLLKSKGFICELYDQSGRLIQTVPFGFTEPLRIKLIPITPK